MTDELRCPECGRRMVKRNGKYGLYLTCERWPTCDVTHSLHADGRPMGTPANRETRFERIRAHEAFDKFWQKRKMKRTEAYAWLARVMGVTKDEAHIGMFNFNQCKALQAVIADHEPKPPTEQETIENWGRKNLAGDRFLG